MIHVSHGHRLQQEGAIKLSRTGKYKKQTGKGTKGAMLMILLLVFLRCGLASAAASTVESAPATDFVYVSNGSEVQINEYKGKGGVVKIPDEIDGVPVTRIAAYAFCENSTITGLELPAYLTYIGHDAFQNCRNLTGILVLPEFVKTMDYNAFYCADITGLIITSDCKLDWASFAYCEELEFIYITEGAAPGIGEGAFVQTKGQLKTVIIPNTVNSIHDRGFEGGNAFTIYTPEGSTAQKFASKKFINCNTDQYEAMQREYDQKYGDIIGNNNGTESYATGGKNITESGTSPKSFDSIRTYFQNIPKFSSEGEDTWYCWGGHGFKEGNDSYQMFLQVLGSKDTISIELRLNMANAHTSANSIQFTIDGDIVFDIRLPLSSGNISAMELKSRGEKLCQALSDCHSLSIKIMCSNGASYSHVFSMGEIMTENGICEFSKKLLDSGAFDYASCPYLASLGYGLDDEKYVTIKNEEKIVKANDNGNRQEGDHTRNGDLYTYSIKGNGSVSITDYDWSKSSGDIYIPTMLDGYSVTEIGNEAFAGGKEISKENCMVVIPESITMIGEKAFFNSPISAISIPTSIKSIGNAAFAYCDITQFIVDQNQPNYATIDGVLYDKRSKTLLAYPQKKSISSKIPEGIQSIGEYAFSGMTIGKGNQSDLSLTDILPSTLTRIEPYAFENCTLYYSRNNADDSSNGIRITLLPSKVDFIGEHAFTGCTFKCNSNLSPKTIVIAENLEEIDDYAFSECKFYDGFDFDLIISDTNLDRIGESAFASSVMFANGNGKMKVRIHLPEEVNEIGENAFYATHPVCIPEDMVIRILGDSAFRNTIVYTPVEQAKNNTPASLSVPGKIKTVPEQAFAYEFNDALNTVETIEVQDGIKKIENSAFAGRKNLRTVSLPMTLTEIGSNAFSGCLKMGSINIPESVTKIGDNAFERQYVTLIVIQDSYAEIWASENGYNYRYEEMTDSLDWLNSDIH